VPPILGLVSAFSIHVDAQTSASPPVELASVTLRSNRTATATRIVDRNEMRRQLYRTTPQSLRDVPGMMIQETSAGQGSPYLRGFTGYQNLFLIDGIRLNNSVFRSGPNQYWNTVDSYSLERLEVRPGAQSSRHGSDAIGGVVSAVTRSPELSDARTSSGEASYRVSSAENAHTAHLDVSHQLAAKTAMRVGGTVKSFGDLVSGDPTGRQPNTGYDEWDADAKIVHALHENAQLTFAYQHVRQDDVPRTHRTLFASPFAGTSAGGELQRSLDQQRQLAYARLEAMTEGGIDHVSAAVAWQRQDEKRFRSRAAGTDHQGFTIDTFSAQSTLASDTPVGLLEYGFDYYRDRVNSFSSGNAIQGPVADDASYDLLGLFLRDRMNATETLVLTLGGRYQFASVIANRVRDPASGLTTTLGDHWHAGVGDLRVDWRVVPERLIWSTSASQGFRAPNLSDLTRFDIARSGEVETAAPGLDPEHYLNLETGLELRDSRWQVRLAAFHTRIRDQIVRVPTGALIGGNPEVTKRNVGDGYMKGVELSGTFRPAPAWDIFGHLAWQEGKVDTFPTAAPIIRREYADRLMPLTAQIGLRHDRKRWWTEGRLQFAAKADRLSTRDAADTQRIPPGGTPGHVVAHLRA
jgi:hemoglobin/transferrin/lactoferrin receptor protein